MRRPLPGRHPATRYDVRIVCISGALLRNGRDEVLRMARQLGADAVLNKPFSPAALFDALCERREPDRIAGGAGA